MPTINPMTKDRFNEIVKEVHMRLIRESTEEVLAAFFWGPLNGNDLNSYHDNLGRWIRNEYNLWSYEWVPELKEAARGVQVDVSPMHPDAISDRIIKEIWKLGYVRESSNT